MSGDTLTGGERVEIAGGDRPVARVIVDTPLPHLDRPFDYLVPKALDAAARPGVRVRVRFAGRLLGGYLLDRVPGSEHPGRLAAIQRVVGEEPVLTPELARLAREVADRWAGVMSDVLRLAIPPRHAAAEREPSLPATPVIAGDLPDLSRYDGGPDVLRRLRRPVAGGTPPATSRPPRDPVRAVWSVLPGPWVAEVAAAVAAVVSAGGGAVVVAPDGRDVDRIATGLRAALGDASVVALAADLGPRERYRRWLAVRRGAAPVVVGTRAAVWAPVRDLRLLVVWDDGDDSLAEPHAPYPHARDVAALRAHLIGAHLIVAGHAVSTDAQLLVESGWASALDPTPAARRRSWPAIRAVGEDEPGHTARLPTAAWRIAHDALATGPVLVQVPRRGYQPGLACAGCRAPARCPRCQGPLARPAADAPVSCRWCGASAAGWRCPHCDTTGLRTTVVGAARTAEELARAFPGVAVRTSTGDAPAAPPDPDRPAVVVATPGAEPPVAGGYAAALLLDTRIALSRPDLRAAEEALRRWLAAAALVRPADDGGRVAVVAAAGLPVVTALVTAHPRAFAARELAERRALHLPPAARVVALRGSPAAVAQFRAALELPSQAEVLGPVELPAADGERQEQLIVRVPPAAGRALAAAVRRVAATRSARREEPVRVTVDPLYLG